MSKVAITDENKEALAQAIVEDMDIETLMNCWKDHLIDTYDEDAEQFQEDWENVME